MQNYFSKFRKNIIGIDQTITTPYHKSIKILYADWTASGRNYKTIEEKLQHEIMPYVANTHTDTNQTGMRTTYAYHKAQQIIKQHVNASKNDVLISSNSGMTGVVNKLQRILGLKVHESFKQHLVIPQAEKPVVFITHMEHHSNQTSWLETIADVIIIPPAEDGLVSVDNFKTILEEYQDRKIKIAAITSCSNVTGIMTPYLEIAKLIHAKNGLCFVDFACSAPYVDINMHVNDEDGSYLDAIYFSPHKFLGGPGTTGILVFNQKLYNNQIPDEPGGGTVDWTNPWGEHKYIDNIEARKDGGTPAFLQTIKAAMCIKLKEEMGVQNILNREEEILKMFWDELPKINNLHILAQQHKHRLGVISFYIDNLHFNLGVKLLNDKFGIQTRGGCSCAGTYGHYLLSVNKEISHRITSSISAGDCSLKPGWIRMSIHPTLTNEEINYLIDGVKQLAANYQEWSKEYTVDYATGTITSNIDNIEKDIEQKIDDCLTNFA